MGANSSVKKKLVGTDLKDFSVVEMTEVFRVNEDGYKIASFGFFKDPDIAAASASVKLDPHFHRTGQVLVLTDGIEGYVIDEGCKVVLLDDDAEAARIRDLTLAKLSPAQRKLLGHADK